MRISDWSSDVCSSDLWAGSGDGSRSADEMRALELLGLEADADFTAVKKGWREMAKMVHPDVKPGDAAAAHEFQKLQIDRKSVVLGKSGSVRVDLGGRRIIKKQQKYPSKSHFK